jgi:hypothetical protein
MADVTGWGIAVGAGIAVATSTLAAIVKAALDERAARNGHSRQLERDQLANDYQLTRDRLTIRQRHLDERRGRVRGSVEAIIAAAREVAEAALDVERAHGSGTVVGLAEERYELARSHVIEASIRLALEPEFDSLRSDFFRLIAEPFATYIGAWRGVGSGPEGPHAPSAVAREALRIGYEKLADHARELIVSTGERYPLASVPSAGEDSPPQ